MPPPAGAHWWLAAGSRQASGRGLMPHNVSMSELIAQNQGLLLQLANQDPNAKEFIEKLQACGSGQSPGASMATATTGGVQPWF